jgi:glycosyltransferase involved in cell wall biosynthesis
LDKNSELVEDPKMFPEQPNITVIIATKNRADSLRVTLECLASANRDGIRAEILVVDNAGSDNTKEVAQSFADRFPVRYLYEPTTGVYGKSSALNRALDAGGLGELIAILDDDMSPDSNWFQALADISKRWPDKDIFTGHTYIIWPNENVPDWAKKKKLESWLFSSVSYAPPDFELQEGRWFSGNHIWFRSRILNHKPKFKDIWATEPDFQLDLVERGFGGVASSEAVAGHRIQPSLLQRDLALARAKKTGACGAWLRLQPYRKRLKHARMLHEHPLLGRLFFLANLWRWRFLYLTSFLHLSDGDRFANRLFAVERMSIYRELFRIANRLPDYSLWKRVPSGYSEVTKI